MTKASLLYLASFVAHGALAAGVVSIKGARKTEVVSVAVFEEKAKKKETPPPPPPPPEEAKPEKAKAKVQARAEAPKPPPVDAPAPVNPGPAAADVPDFGLTLGGGGASGGLAVPTPRATAAPSSSAPSSVTKKVLAAPVPTADACTEAPKKPKVVTITQPAYTAQAREANIAGKVRIEVTVDLSGHVSNARVLEGLGYGLDEAAIAAARAATFEPGTKCGNPSVATFVIAIRFAL